MPTGISRRIAMRSGGLWNVESFSDACEFAAKIQFAMADRTGWGHTDFPNRLPDKKYLDTVIPDRPGLYLGKRRPHGRSQCHGARSCRGALRPRSAAWTIGRDRQGNPPAS
jgi:hypothetical protein